jgi:hypothetical protein
MMVPWLPQPSPDAVRPTSWRIRLLARLGPAHGASHRGSLAVTLDTGALWTTITDDHAVAAGINDIATGIPTEVNWLGLTHPAWQHRIRLTVDINPDQTDSITLDDLNILFIRQFPHVRTGRPVSLAVLGMDCLAQLRMTLDGPAAATRF